MKPLFVLLYAVSMAILVSCSTAKTAPETRTRVTQKIESRDYTIQATYANPVRGRQIYLTSDYDIRVKSDSAFAFLPYFGVAYVAPFNPTEGGIKFAEPIRDYSAVLNKKNNGWDIRFKVRAKEYNYEFFLNVFDNGNSSFTVNSYQRDPITFHGEMKF